MATLYGFAATLGQVLPFAGMGHDDDPGWIFGLVFWIALIAVVILLLRNRGWLGPGPRPPHENGTQILERRFAEGELNAEEYRERRSVLDELSER